VQWPLEEGEHLVRSGRFCPRLPLSSPEAVCPKTSSPSFGGGRYSPDCSFSRESYRVEWLPIRQSWFAGGFGGNPLYIVLQCEFPFHID